MVTVACQKTIVSDAGWEIQKQSAGIAVGAAIATYLYTGGKLDSSFLSAVVGGLVPFTTGMLLNTYGKLCKSV